MLARVLRTSSSVVAVAAILVGLVCESRADLPPLPEEAYQACAGKSDGEACSVVFHDQKITGSCVPHPADKRLFCMPAGPPPR